MGRFGRGRISLRHSGSTRERAVIRPRRCSTPIWHLSTAAPSWARSQIAFAMIGWLRLLPAVVAWGCADLAVAAVLTAFSATSLVIAKMTRYARRT